MALYHSQMWRRVINNILTHLVIEPTVTNCDISDNNIQLKFVIADARDLIFFTTVNYYSTIHCWS